MSDTFFVGSYGGSDHKLDNYWQISPGTPFSQLHDHWRRPNCDGNKQLHQMPSGLYEYILRGKLNQNLDAEQ